MRNMQDIERLVNICHQPPRIHNLERVLGPELENIQAVGGLTQRR